MESAYAVNFDLKLRGREVSDVCLEGRHQLSSTLEIHFIDKRQEFFRDNLRGANILISHHSSTSTSYPPCFWVLPYQHVDDENPPFLSQPYFFSMLARIGLRPVIHHALAQAISRFAIQTSTEMGYSSFTIVTEVEFLYAEIYEEQELLPTYFDRYRELESMVVDGDFDDYSRVFNEFFEELRAIAQNESADEFELIEWLSSRLLESQQQRQNSRVCRDYNEPYGETAEGSCRAQAIEDGIEATEREDSDSCDDGGAPRELVAMPYYLVVHECCRSDI